MINSILNYGIRLIIIILGILIFFDYFNISRGDVRMVKAIGVIMVLFGLYRIVTYYHASKRYKRVSEKNNEEE